MPGKILVIIPSNIVKNIKKDADINRLSDIFVFHAEVFMQDEGNYQALKKQLVENKYEVICLCYLNFYNSEIPEVQMIKSLASGSRLALYLPDLGFRGLQNGLNSGNNSDLVSWHEAGKRIQLNVFKQADVIITRNASEKDFLLKEVPGADIVSNEEQKLSSFNFRKRDSKLISIIMLTFNQLEDTKRCYESLMKHQPEKFELIFVDNGSRDGTREYLNSLKSTDDRIRLLFNESNVGFSKANNQGIRISNGEYVLLLNNDVILTEGWIQTLLACSESDSETGVVGPCTNSAVGRQVTGTEIKLDERDIDRFAALQSIANAGCWFSVHRIIGFCMLIKKEVIVKVGMLDERFGPGGFEDYDFCLRVKQAGYKIMVAGDVFIYHIGGSGYSKNNLDYNKLRQQNVQIFIDKWCRKALEIMESL